MCSQLESMDSENTELQSKKRSDLMDRIKKQEKKHVGQRSHLKTKTIRLYPTIHQQRILKRWFGVTRWFYNRTVDYTNEHKIYDFKKVRNAMRVDGKYPLPDWSEEEVCPRVITGAISDCCKAYKTCFTQLKNKTINRFKLSYRTKKDPTQTLYLEKSCFNKGGLVPKYGIGKIKGVYKRKQVLLKDILIDCDSRLVERNGRWTLYVPEYFSFSDGKVSGGLISLDSGVRTFQTGYSPSSHTVELGTNMKDLNPLLNKIDKLYSATTKYKKKKKKVRLFSRIKRTNEKIRNKVDDLHWKTIKFLTSNYQTVVISDFRVQELLKGKLNRYSKRLLSTGRHYVFGERLKYKASLRGVDVFFVDESYTSKTCSCCGELNYGLGGSKDFNCDYCGSEMDRDINAARNILIKNWDVLPSELHVG